MGGDGNRNRKVTEKQGDSRVEAQRKGEDIKRGSFTPGQSEAGNCVSADSSDPKAVEGQREQRRRERRWQHGVRGR